MSMQKRARMNDEDAWSDNGLMQKRAPVDETARFDECIFLPFADLTDTPEDLGYISQQDLAPKDLTDTPIRASLPGVAGYEIHGCKRVDSQVRSEAHATLGVKERLNQPTAMSVQKRACMNDEYAWSPLYHALDLDDLDELDELKELPEPSISSPSCISPPILRSPSIDETAMSDEDKLTCLQLFPLDDSYPEPQKLSYVSQQDLAPEDLKDMLCPVNAEAEPNIEFPQGTLSRDHTEKIKYGSFDRKDSLPNGGIGWQKIGKIDYCSRKEIAKGSNGTIVLEGIYEGRPVAVKRLVRAHCDVASNEIQILRAHDGHKNIVRYHGVESNSEFVYLALERCACSLDELIQVHSDSSNNSAFPGDPASTDDYKIKLDSIRGMMQDANLWRADGYPSPLLRKLMRHVVKGLSYLHGSRIIHRDLKPRNVLITRNQPFCAQLSDMGISKYLPEDKSSLGYHDTGCGTSGWRAPELLRHGGRQTRAMDVFSLGCVLCFFFTRGRHPFGENVERDYNIVYNKMDLSFVDMPEAHDLFLCLLNQDPKLRPEASEVLHHPFFWSSKTRLSFLSDVSDIVEFETRASNLDLLNALESTAQSVFVGNWEDKIEPAVRAELWRRRRYDGSLVRHLLRAVRNVYGHHMEFPEEVKEILGPVADGLDYYFAIRFPRLLIESYRVVSQICIRKELLEGVLSK